MSKYTIPQQFDRELTAGNVKQAMKAAGASSGDLWRVPRNQIRVLPGFNARIHTDAYKVRVRALAESMKIEGYYQDKPLAGFVGIEDGNQVIYLTDGHTRLDAVDLAISEGAEIEKLPIVTKPNGTSMTDLTVALVTSNNGTGLTPVELGVVCKRLVGYGMTEPEIARRLGYTPQYVNKLLRLMGAPKSILDRVIAYELSANAALDAIAQYGSAASEVLTKAAADAKTAGKARVTPKAVKNAAAKSGKTSAAPKSSRPTDQSTLPSVPNDAPPPRSITEAWPFPSQPAASPPASPANAAPPSTSTAGHAITDGERYRHLMSRIDTEIYFDGFEFHSKNDLDAAIDADIRVREGAGMVPTSGR